MVERRSDRNRIRTVALEVPAVPTSLRLVRLAVADVMTTGRFSVAGIERGALVIDELASVLITSVDSERLDVELHHAPLELRATGRVTGRDGEVAVPELDGIAREVLDAGVGDAGRWHLGADRGVLCFEAELLA